MDERYPVRLVHHNNRYAGHLFDVDGNVLRGESGDVLNVFKEEMKDMMISKKVRFIHQAAKEPTYAYFITDPEQCGRFLLDREEGSIMPDKCYHVYPDV